MEIFKLIIQVIISGAFIYALCVIGSDLFCNISDIRKEKRLLSRGRSAHANIILSDVHYERPKNTTITYSTIRYVTIEYDVDGKIYKDSVVLRDIDTNVSDDAGIEIIYDMNKLQDFILADGSTSKSAKNSIKWDFAYLFCTIILWLFLFLKIGTP